MGGSEHSPEEKSPKEREAIREERKSRSTGRVGVRGPSLPNTGRIRLKRRREQLGGQTKNLEAIRSAMRKKGERESFPKGRRMKRCTVQRSLHLKRDHMQAEKLRKDLVLGRRARKGFPKLATGQVPVKASRRRSIPVGRMKDTTTSIRRKKKSIQKRKKKMTTLRKTRPQY